MTPADRIATFRDWLVSIGGANLLDDSYSFKRGLLAGMSAAFAIRGPEGAISFAKTNYDSVGHRIETKHRKANP